MAFKNNVYQKESICLTSKNKLRCFGDLVTNERILLLMSLLAFIK
jgi:hypothetical protein